MNNKPTTNHQPQTTNSFEHIVKASEGGDAEAMNTVAGIYAHGDEGQPVDGVKAILWYERASSAGPARRWGTWLIST